jgi:hypothetical protein
VLLMSTKLQILNVSFHTQRRDDVEPPSVADSLRECATTSPRALQAAFDNVEDEVVEVFFFPLGSLSSLANLSEQPL